MTAAVLVIDMQNGFCDPRGSIPLAGQSLPNMPSVIAANAALIASAREHGLPVIFTRHVYRTDLMDMPKRIKAQIPLDPPPLVRGSWDGDIVSELAPQDGDRVIDKNRYDAFLYTDLEVVLRSMGVDRLLVSGVVTSVCVESTVRSGNMRDFDMFVASDCTSAAEEAQGPSLAAMAAMFADIGPWRELLATVSETPAVAV